MPYQLRIPGNWTLGAVVKTLAGRLAREVAGGGNSEALAVAFETVLRQRLKATVLTTDVCGAQVMCDEGTSPSAWNYSPDPSLSRVDPNHPEHVKRFRLEWDGSLEQWLSTLVLSLHSVLPQRLSGADVALMEGVVKEILGPYLYVNELCGGTDLCQYATPVADVWNI